MVKIIDVDDDMGFDNICREAELMADSYECDVKAIGYHGEEKGFGPSFEKDDEDEDEE